MKNNSYLGRTIGALVLTPVLLFGEACSTVGYSRESGEKPHWAIRYVADLPNGVLKLLDSTLGQVDRLRDGDPTDLSGVYERNVPTNIRVGLAASAWYGTLNVADRQAVRRGWINEDDSVFGHRDREPSGPPAKYSRDWWLQEYVIERNSPGFAPAKDMDFDSWYKMMTEPIIYDDDNI